MNEELHQRVQAWIADDPEAATRAELQALLDANDEAALAERFDGRLQFGTAGLRGLMGGGPNRMNEAVVARLAGAVSALLREEGVAGSTDVVVGHDARRTSRGIAERAARVLLGAGHRVALFDGPAPTPMVVYAGERHGAAVTLVVTASHNPPDYNGCKVYWRGAQIVPPIDRRIADHIDAIARIADLPLGDLADAAVLGDADREAYTAKAASLVLGVLTRPADLSIAYTAMHGVGGDTTVEALRRAGFERVAVVAEQHQPDATFPTVAFPNPEEDGAMDRVLARAAEVGADLVLANDPDADRLAVSVLHEGAYVPLTGNEIGCLLAHFALVAPSAPPERGMLLSSIVSSTMLLAIGEAHGVRAEQTLTGHKWIHARARELEAEGHTLLLGYEEALGYAVTGEIRDKDGITAAVRMAEMAAWCAERDRTIIDELHLAWRRYGMYRSEQVSWVLPGAEGRQKIEAAMARAASDPPRELGGLAVVAMSDVAAGSRRVIGGGTEPLALPRADLVIYELEGGHRVMLRPSGTEPKLKQYFDVRIDVTDDEAIDAALARATTLLARLVEDLAANLETP